MPSNVRSAGQLIRPSLGLLNQPRVLQSCGGLVGEGHHQVHVLLREVTLLRTVDSRHGPQRLVSVDQRHNDDRSAVCGLTSLLRAGALAGVGLALERERRLPLAQYPSTESVPEFLEGRRDNVIGAGPTLDEVRYLSSLEVECDHRGPVGGQCFDHAINYSL